MFFYLSKTVGFFLMPSNFLCCLAVLGLLLTRTRHVQTGRKIVSLSLITLFFMAYSPFGNWILYPLEERLSRPIEGEKMSPPYGILVLGGALDTAITKARGSIAMNEAAERLVETIRLARRFPKARILFTGGSAQIIYEGMSEAVVAKRLFSQMGIAPERIIFEPKSQNTWQNALYSKDLLKSESDKQWLLVTSAFHMARSVGCFQKVGMEVIAWPVDYRTRGRHDLYRFFTRASEGWERVDLATREWIGLLAYWLTGRTSHLFPQ